MNCLIDGVTQTGRLACDWKCMFKRVGCVIGKSVTLKAEA